LLISIVGVGLGGGPEVGEQAVDAGDNAVDFGEWWAALAMV
jgi:hypothetical protein